MSSRFKQLHLTFAGQIESVDLIANLPTQGMVVGAIRYVEEDDLLYTFDGVTWNSVGSGGDATFDTLTANTLIVNNFTYLNSNVVTIGDNIVVLNSEVTGNPTVAHANSAVTPGSYGSATAVPVITVGATGHIDAISTAAVIGSEWNELITTADIIVSSNTTLTNVTELGFSAVSGNTYYCEYTVMFRTAATTTGIALTLGTSNTAAGTLAAQVNIPIAADGTAALYTGNITALDDVVTATGVQTAQPTWFLATMRAVFICTTSGTFLPKFRSEVNGSNVNFGTGSVAIIRAFS